MKTVLWIGCISVVLIAFLIGAWLSGCGEDDDCLPWGECCTTQCLQEKFGTTDKHCCPDLNCRDGFCEMGHEE